MRPEYIFMNLVAPAFILVPVITALVVYRHLPAAAKTLLYYLLFDTVVSTTSSLLAYHHRNNMPLYHVATIIDTMILLYFFSQVFSNYHWAGYIRIAVLVFPVLGILNIIFAQPLNIFNSYMLSLKSLLVIALCFLYWWQGTGSDERQWKDIPLNWICSGLLLYFSSAFILFTFSHWITSVASRSVSIVLWNIHAGLSVLMFGLLAIGFKKYKS